MTIIVDDAGSGDILFGVVLGAYRSETHEFIYDVVSVKYFQSNRFRRKEYLDRSSKIVFRLLDKLNYRKGEGISMCRGYIFDTAAKDLAGKFGDSQINRVKVTGEPQYLTETAYIDEIRNLGYEPIKEREKKRAKSFFHMLRWLREDPRRTKHAKTGWPRLSRYHPFSRRGFPSAKRAKRSSRAPSRR
ncbi:MAG: hypothetical protein NWE82_03845 [Candidatus Bathyarchaeota archaeon]|jgi:hypothetical protein|nr:hypothetical protein [Candidatus Bathyarchaeota archaeon]